MANTQALSSRYIEDEKDNLSDPAQDIFNEALVIFKSDLSKDQTKLKWIEDSNFGNLYEVLAAISEARAQYELRKGDSATYKYLCDLSERIHYYGNIMDVMVQHHPEYVSLAWGAMKFLFVGIVNQQKLLSRLSNGLCQIADVLPRAELLARLYPTSRVKHAIATMYAHILKFLIRSFRWYQETRLSHIIHAIMRPAELRFDDLIEQITSLSRNMTELALASGHAEQRDMHMEQRQYSQDQKVMQTKVDYLTELVMQLRDSFTTDQAINASARIELCQSLSEIQISQLLSYISASILLDPTKSLQVSLFMRNRRRLKAKFSGPPFWHSQKLHSWNYSSSSALVMIKGTRKLRFHIRDFCSDSILILRKKQTLMIWALKAIESHESPRNLTSTIDLLKYLLLQAVRFNNNIHTDAAISSRLKAYWSAETESDWFDILASVVRGFPLLYIIIDVELLNLSLANLTEEFSWSVAFLSLFSGLAERNIKTTLKVAMVSYGSPIFKEPMSNDCQELLLPVGGSSRSVREPVRSPNMRGGIHARERDFDLYHRGKRRRLR